jgi:hypothetical protein
MWLLTRRGSSDNAFESYVLRQFAAMYDHGGQCMSHMDDGSYQFGWQ